MISSKYKHLIFNFNFVSPYITTNIKKKEETCVHSHEIFKYDNVLKVNHDHVGLAKTFLQF